MFDIYNPNQNPTSNSMAWSVQNINLQIKTILQNSFGHVLVTGEVMRPTLKKHLYFTLRDENNHNQVINCVCWASRLPGFGLKEGQKVLISGKITAYGGQSKYQIDVETIEDIGVGALQKKFEILKKTLFEKGYFDGNHKKPLPAYPKKVALLTSKTGAVIQDMLKIAKGRFFDGCFVLVPTPVQGNQAHIQIASNIKKIDNKGFDTIVLARGGGGLEDLWCFNEKIVADAIFEAKTPIISAIGHESDFVISDFVSDIRASTPSNAIEILLPDTAELKFAVDEKFSCLHSQVKILINKNEKTFQIGIQKSHANKIKLKIENFTNEIEALHNLFDLHMNQRIKTLQKAKEEKLKLMHSLSTSTKLQHQKESLKQKKQELRNVLQNLIQNLNYETTFKKEQIKKFSPHFLLKSTQLKRQNELLNSRFAKLFDAKIRQKKELQLRFLDIKKNIAVEKGFALVLKNGQKTSLSQLQINDWVTLQDNETTVEVQVTKK